MKRFDDFETLKERIGRDINFMMYHMNGAYTKEDLWMLSGAEIEWCMEFIKDNRIQEKKFQAELSNMKLI